MAHVKLPLFPLHTVLFPGMALPLHIFEQRYRSMVSECLHSRRPFGVVLIKSGREVGAPAVPYPVGTTARIARVDRMPNGCLNIEAIGQERFRLVEVETEPSGRLAAVVQPFPLATGDSAGARQAARALAPFLGRYLALLAEAAHTTLDARRLPRDPASIAFLAAIVAQIPLAEKQELLSAPSAADLLRREHTLYRREISLLRSMLSTGATIERAPIYRN